LLFDSFKSIQRPGGMSVRFIRLFIGIFRQIAADRSAIPVTGRQKCRWHDRPLSGQCLKV